MKLQFNQRGYLEPNDVIEISHADFKELFVFNEHRQMLFEAHCDFLAKLQALELGNFRQWVNGSFTTKKVQPNDIDVVTFVDHVLFDKHESVFREWYRNRKQGKIDCYFVRVYPEGHQNYFLTQSDTLQFWHDFTRDYKKKSEKKGFIQLNFSNNEIK
jgi:hypothetical protein